MDNAVNIPISLTLARISSSRVHALIAAAIFGAASLTDWLDGVIARRRNQVTTLGKLLDPVADKLLVAAALIALVQTETIPAWMAVVIIGREFAVTALRGISFWVGVIVPASTLAKYKTATQYVAITLLILEKGVPPIEYVPLYWVAIAALWAALALTVVSGADYFYRFFRKADYRALVRDTERWS
ncbi:MAG: CDP-diacylglycerol--glycerol-3-phosphate 3-phosphatidyltransferase [Candidatus Rokubacteria bacterium]|nr:CDP-diacylglycerol--glycerol-3-phosphate 3-phosphatidyltransferase [Candidatus Rokubacteria bacterium]